MPLVALVGSEENDVVEGLDVRAVVLTSGDPGVDVQTPPGELRIRDNDGKGVLSSGGRWVGGGGGLDARAVVLTSGDPGVDVQTPPGELRIRDNDGERVLSSGGRWGGGGGGLDVRAVVLTSGDPDVDVQGLGSGKIIVREFLA